MHPISSIVEQMPMVKSQHAPARAGHGSGVHVVLVPMNRPIPKQSLVGAVIVHAAVK